MAGIALGVRREGHFLVAAGLDIGLADLLAHPERPITDEVKLQRWLEERAHGAPLAYLSHRQDFFGRTFFIDERVLIPRPETELLVEEAILLAQPRWRGDFTIADIGTGSGCIAITLALELPHVRLWATDLSASALEVARRNAFDYAVESRITFLEGDLLDPLPGPVDLLVANLPYVSSAWLAGEPSIAFEPRQALDGGEDGADLLRRLLLLLPSYLRSSGSALLEIGEEQSFLAGWAQEHLGGTVTVIPDLAGKPRLIRLRT
ncbi:MAG: peptide chain release factor N(5)-glutamine methyltransferase [Coprothermobacterota bacterium]|nr:peptide chain release factor N(5)-glutamine methyltransferase [Coprothermobacterota bacterium]